MELSNLEESLSGPIPSSFYRTIALAEENDVELGVKLRMAESNLVAELKKLRENQQILKETYQKKAEWQTWFESFSKQCAELYEAQKISDSNLSKASENLSECLEKRKMLEITLEEVTAAETAGRNEERAAKKEYRRRSEAFGARSTLEQLTDAKISRLEK